MKEDTYKTVAAPAGPAVYKDRGSKFLGYAFPVENRDEVKRFLEQIKSEHHAARHWCYAYRIGKQNIEERANDDGEPAHSAGTPILNQIKSAGLTDVLVIVVRYFGGVKLGVGGLIQAYKTAAKDVLEQAEIVEREILTELTVRFPYDKINEVMRIVKRMNLKITGRQSAEDMQLSIAVKPGEKDRLIEALSALHRVDIRNGDNKPENG